MSNYTEKFEKMRIAGKLAAQNFRYVNRKY